MQKTPAYETHLWQALEAVPQWPPSLEECLCASRIASAALAYDSDDSDDDDDSLGAAMPTAEPLSPDGHDLASDAGSNGGSRQLDDAPD